MIFVATVECCNRFPANILHIRSFVNNSESIKTTGAVFLFSQPLQCGVILVILIISIIANCSVIINIINSDIKKSIVTFVIIKNLCIVDLFGACLILPAPLAATIKGVKNIN